MNILIENKKKLNIKIFTKEKIFTRKKVAHLSNITK